MTKLISASKQLKEYMAGAIGLVEATSFERMCLWRSHTANPYAEWNDKGTGFGHTVAFYNSRPIFVSLLTTTIDEHKVLFYEVTSRLVDYELVTKWFKRELPNIPKVNASNFYNIFPIKEAIKCIN